MKKLVLAVGGILLMMTPMLSLAQTAPVLRFIGFSTKFPPGDSLAFRKAIDCALDREAIVKAVTPFAGRLTVRAAFSINHPNLPGFDASIKGCGYDPAKAKELFAQSGWSTGVTILAPRPTTRFAETFDRSVAESIQQALGVTVTYQPVANFNVLVDAAKSGSAPVWMFGWVANPRDYGYPSFALGIAKELISAAEIAPLVETKSSAAVEKMLLDKAFIIPVIFF